MTKQNVIKIKGAADKNGLKSVTCKQGRSVSFSVLLLSGGSRISSQGEGTNLLFSQIFLENCMKMKAIGLRRVCLLHPT